MRRRTTAALVAACLLLTACGIGMPDSGPVRQTRASVSDREDDASNIKPLQPGKGDTPEQIVRGFLEAMRATPPIQTSYAREFLTQEADADWKPSGMVVYDKAATLRVNGGVDAVLTGADRTDARGAWLGPLTPEESTVGFTLDVERQASGSLEWRITDPPPWLMVPKPWFGERFRPVSLYYFDPSATMLIPEPVFVPGGPQFASALVSGLLQGPATETAATEQNFLPPDLHLVSASVPVSVDGLAKVDLTSDSGDAPLPSPEVTERLVSQLAWTLHQDTTIERFSVSIDGQRVQLPGESDFSVEHGHEYAPYVAGSSTPMYGLLQNDQMVGGSPQNLETVAGPFGRGGYDLRVVSADLHADQVAGVSADGTTLYLGPVKDTGGFATPLTTSGEDLLRPAWDFRRVWDVDRRSGGAVVSYLEDGRLRTIDVPGVSHKDVKDFLISRDGSRLIAVLHDPVEGDSVVVSRILTSSEGQVISALTADTIVGPDDVVNQIRDIAWSSATNIMVLRPVTRGFFQVDSASVDGAPTGVDSLALPVGSDVVGLIGTPVPDETLFAFGDGALSDLAGPLPNSITIDPHVVSLSYVG